jgi:MerR family transcriptional regulator, light-induced transcriptional regulator
LYRFSAIAVDDPDLTTAQLAERTGLTAGVLRMWENRHGFPVPARLPSGHRRYSGQDVEMVLDVLRLRRQGLSLPAAIERARHRRRLPAASVFAGLRRRRPDIAPVVLLKPAVLALTRAIEDEYCAHAAGGVLIGCFQRAEFYRGAERRWRELARTTDLAVALAEFAAPADADDGPVEVAISARHPLAREWAVVISADTVQACLAAWEQPSSDPLYDRRRRFEVLWSFDPAVVADAVAVTVELLESLHAPVAQRIAAARHGAPPSTEEALRNGGALAQRMVGYLAQRLA